QFAGFVKADVRRAVGVEARDCKSSALTVCCISGDDNFAVALHSDTAAVVEFTKVRSCFAGSVEGGVESPVCVIPRDREIVVTGEKHVSHDDNLPVALQSYAICAIGVASDLGHNLARFAKPWVERAIGIVSHHSEFGA